LANITFNPNNNLDFFTNAMDSISLKEGETNTLNIIGIKIGDVSGNAKP